MRPKRDILDYLNDIADAIDAALSFVVDMDVTQFRADQRTVYAIIHALEIVGEAAKRIPEPVRVRYPAVQMTNRALMEFGRTRIRNLCPLARHDKPGLDGIDERA